MNYFLTKDLYIASYLTSCGCKLDSSTRTDGVTMFSFVRTRELEKLVDEYFSLRALVNPVKYDEAMKSLRNLALGPKNTLSSRVAM